LSIFSRIYRVSRKGGLPKTCQNLPRFDLAGTWQDLPRRLSIFSRIYRVSRKGGLPKTCQNLPRFAVVSSLARAAGYQTFKCGLRSAECGMKTKNRCQNVTTFQNSFAGQWCHFPLRRTRARMPAKCGARRSVPEFFPEPILLDFQATCGRPFVHSGVRTLVILNAERDAARKKREPQLSLFVRSIFVKMSNASL
jgi:hypothetical protein